MSVHILAMIAAGLSIENWYDDVPADPKAPSFK
jgi:hypothetical protein